MALKREISEKLLNLHDEKLNEKPIKQVYDRYQAYEGPYVQDAPDLIVGFRVGYRAAWDCVTGGVGDTVFEDNTRPWGGDHNMNPPDVPGMFFCNRSIAKKEPRIEDIGPTTLDLFGIPIPEYCDGESFMPVLNGVMTVQQLIDIVALLQSSYEIAPPTDEAYSYRYQY